MGAPVIDTTAATAPGVGAHAERLFAPGGPTLEDLVIATWDELVETGHADCPVCWERMSAVAGCSGCGSE